MQRFIDLSQPEQNELIFRTSSALKIAPALVEKDFWVSWLLNLIFQDEISKNLTFKGGTSLSKCYGVLSRFSEDIDLTINRELFSEAPGEASLSNKALQRLIEVNEEKASKYVSQIFKEHVAKLIGAQIGEKNWSLKADEIDPKNLRFYYPIGSQINEDNYFKRSVLLEMGVRGEINPSEQRQVISYVESINKKFLVPNLTNITTLSPIRTFWEKITILHAQNHRPKDKTFCDRLSRHYYDTHMLIKHGYADEALKNLSLLNDVINHNRKFFRAGWAHYETALPGTLSILPNAKLYDALAKDYKRMEQMLFGDIPSFESILFSLKEFEDKVNHLREI